MVVPSIAAMPMAAIPVAAMPMAMAPVQTPAYTVATQAAPLRSTCGGESSLSPLEQTIARAFVERALSSNGSLTPAAAPTSSISLEAKIEQIDKNLNKLAQLTEHMSEVLKAQDARIKALEKK
jgi:hypothetical protein